LKKALEDVVKEYMTLREGRRLGNNDLSNLLYSNALSAEVWKSSNADST